MLKFITVQLRKDQRAAKRRNLLSKKNMSVQLWFAKLHLNSKTTGQRKQNWRCLAIMDTTMFDENQTLYISTTTSYQLWRAVVERRCLDLFCSNRTWAHCSHWVDHEFLCILKCSRVKCEAICPIANTWLSLGPRTRQWSQVQQEIYDRMAEHEKTQRPIQSLDFNWLKHCGRAYESCVYMTWRYVIYDSSTRIWETDKVEQKEVTLSYGC